METSKRPPPTPLIKFSATGKPLPKIESIDHALEAYQRGIFGALISQYGLSGIGSFKELWKKYQELFQLWYPDEVCP